MSPVLKILIPVLGIIIVIVIIVVVVMLQSNKSAGSEILPENKPSNPSVPPVTKPVTPEYSPPPNPPVIQEKKPLSILKMTTTSEQLVNKLYGMCMNVTPNNYLINVSTCNGSNNQRWSLSESNQYIVNTTSKNNLDGNAGKTTVGTLLGQYTSTNTPNQKWNYYNDYTIRPEVNPTACVASQSESVIALQECNSGARQEWTFAK